MITLTGSRNPAAPATVGASSHAELLAVRKSRAGERHPGRRSAQRGVSGGTETPCGHRYEVSSREVAIARQLSAATRSGRCRQAFLRDCVVGDPLTNDLITSRWCMVHVRSRVGAARRWRRPRPGLTPPAWPRTRRWNPWCRGRPTPRRGPARGSCPQASRRRRASRR